MSLLLSIKDWNGVDPVEINHEDSEIKYLDIMASGFHTDVDDINAVLVNGKYVVDTFITGSEEDSKYELAVKIKYYGNKKEHEHKENTHGQKINI